MADEVRFQHCTAKKILPAVPGLLVLYLCLRLRLGLLLPTKTIPGTLSTGGMDAPVRSGPRFISWHWVIYFSRNTIQYQEYLVIKGLRAHSIGGSAVLSPAQGEPMDNS
eukprot:6270588-Amphidinium_carterae.1